MDIVSDFTLNSLIQTIDRELKERHLMSALFMALTIPDICSGERAPKSKYIEWFNNWVICGDPKPIISGKDCYDIRCGMLHSGTTDEPFSLSCDNKNDIHLGHITSVITDNNTGEKEKSIRVNINELVENILRGAKIFINKEGDIELFRLMDYGKVED